MNNWSANVHALARAVAGAATQMGVSLIEVLIAMSVMAFGMLGIAGLQTSAISGMHSADQYSQASLLAQSMLERMQANPSAVANGDYRLAVGTTSGRPASDCRQQPCTSREMAAWDLADWYSMIKGQSLNQTGTVASLPSGQASITCEDALCRDDSVWIIAIYWDARHNGASGTGCDPALASDLDCFRLAFVP